MSEYTCNVKIIFQQNLKKYFTVLNLALNSPAPFHHMTGNLVKDYLLYWKVFSKRFLKESSLKGSSTKKFSIA